MGEQNRIFYVVPHSHIDVEWYWTFETTREWTEDIFQRALAFLRRDADYRFTQDQTVLVKTFYEGLNTDERAAFRRAISEKRFAIVGGMYVQPEVAEPSGESLIRQILVGQAWLQATFGLRARCGWFIDTFGQIPQIPQILRRAGYEYNVFWRDIPPHVDFESMPADFWWESPDGSRILTHWMPGGYGSGRHEMRTTIKHSGRHVFLPLGGDVVRPKLDSLAACRFIRSQLQDLGVEALDCKEGVDPEVRMASALEYFDAIAAESSDLPVLKYDFDPPDVAADLRGTYDGRIELKKRNRAAEQALYNAEAIAALAHTAGRPYPKAELAELWEKLLFTQFHDTIGGSNCDSVYVPAMERVASVLEGASRLATGALQAALPAASMSGRRWLAVFNTLSCPRSEICRATVAGASASALALKDAGGRAVPVRVVEEGAGSGAVTTVEFLASDVPATGWKAYEIVEGAVAKAGLPVAEGKALENAHFRVTWDAVTGDLTSIWDKRLGRELLSGSGNVIVAAGETEPDMEGPIFLNGQDASSSDYKATSIEVSQDALALRVQMRSDFQDCTLVREVVLPHFAPRIDFLTTLEDFKGGDVMIKASFPLKIDWSRAERTCETAFAGTRKPGGHFAAQTWADCSDGDFGIALLNRGTPGYWADNGRLEMVLLRSLANYKGYQWRGLYHGVPGYEKSTDMELAREHGTHVFNYSLISHAGTWRQGSLSHAGQSLNTPLVVATGLSQAPEAGDSFVSFSPDFTMTALKVAENGEALVVRGFETRGQAHAVTMRAAPWVRRACRASLLEEPDDPMPIRDGAVEFTCAPHEIVTLLLTH